MEFKNQSFNKKNYPAIQDVHSLVENLNDAILSGGISNIQIDLAKTEKIALLIHLIQQPHLPLAIALFQDIIKNLHTEKEIQELFLILKNAPNLEGVIKMKLAGEIAERYLFVSLPKWPEGKLLSDITRLAGLGFSKLMQVENKFIVNGIIEKNH